MMKDDNRKAILKGVKKMNGDYGTVIFYGMGNDEGTSYFNGSEASLVTLLTIIMSDLKDKGVERKMIENAVDLAFMTQEERDKEFKEAINKLLKENSFDDIFKAYLKSMCGKDVWKGRVDSE